jgi:hypothetical protein
MPQIARVHHSRARQASSIALTEVDHLAHSTSRSTRRHRDRLGRRRTLPRAHPDRHGPQCPSFCSRYVPRLAARSHASKAHRGLSDGLVPRKTYPPTDAVGRFRVSLRSRHRFRGARAIMPVLRMRRRILCCKEVLQHDYPLHRTRATWLLPSPLASS